MCYYRRPNYFSKSTPGEAWKITDFAEFRIGPANKFLIWKRCGNEKEENF